MHTSFAQRVTAIEGLRTRTRQAITEFYQRPGVQPPPLAPLIIVCPSGNNTFSLINRATGVVVAERFCHNTVTKHAREREANAAQFGIKRFGKFLRNWALRSGVILAMLTLFSSYL